MKYSRWQSPEVLAQLLQNRAHNNSFPNPTKMDPLWFKLDPAQSIWSLVITLFKNVKNSRDVSQEFLLVKVKFCRDGQVMLCADIGPIKWTII